VHALWDLPSPEDAPDQKWAIILPIYSLRMVYTFLLFSIDVCGAVSRIRQRCPLNGTDGLHIHTNNSNPSL
jgi:hypothetical protein